MIRRSFRYLRDRSRGGSRSEGDAEEERRIGVLYRDIENEEQEQDILMPVHSRARNLGREIEDRQVHIPTDDSDSEIERERERERVSRRESRARDRQIDRQKDMFTDYRTKSRDGFRTSTSLAHRRERRSDSQDSNSNYNLTKDQVVKLIHQETSFKPGELAWTFPSICNNKDETRANESTAKSLKILKDLRATIPFKFSPQSSNIKQHLLLLSQVLAHTRRSISQAEWNNLVLASLPDDQKKSQVLSLLGKIGISASDEDLNFILSQVYDESASPAKSREKFYKFKPDPTRLRLVEIITDMGTLASAGNIKSSEFIEFVKQILPPSAAVYLMLADRQLSHEEDPNPAAVLRVLEPVKQTLEDELALKYKKRDRGDDKFKKIEEEQGGRYQGPDKKFLTCFVCLGRGHSGNKCFYKGAYNCRKCSGASHSTAECPLYKAPPSLRPCSRCLKTTALTNFHDESSCLQSDKKN